MARADMGSACNGGRWSRERTTDAFSKQRQNETHKCSLATAPEEEADGADDGKEEKVDEELEEQPHDHLAEGRFAVEDYHHECVPLGLPRCTGLGHLHRLPEMRTHLPGRTPAPSPNDNDQNDTEKQPGAQAAEP